MRTESARRCVRRRGWRASIAPITAIAPNIAIATIIVIAGMLPAACAPEPAGIPMLGDVSSGLVFVRRDGDALDLHRARLSDGAVVPLRVTPEVEERWPYWSPGARRLVFQSRPAGRSSGDRLVLLDPDDGSIVPVAEPPARNEHWPVWAPDGLSLAYAFNVAPGGGSPSGLARVDVRTRERHVIGPGGGEVVYFRPEFSPDGMQVVAQRSIEEDESRLWLLGSGEAPRLLTEDTGYEQKGRFTRDGQWIVYTRRIRRGAPGDLVLIRPDGSEGHLVSSTPSFDDHTARPSPTRDELAFISNRRGNSEAFLVPLAGGKATRLTRTPNRRENAPRWSPDGEKIALTVLGHDGEFHVVVVDRTGKVLLDVPGQMPDWMPAWPEAH